MRLVKLTKPISLIKDRWLNFVDGYKRKRFKAHKLGLEDALRLSAILSKYIDTKDIDRPQEPLDFISDLIGKLSPSDYLHCVKLLSGEYRDAEYEKHSAVKILTAFIEGLKLNQILSLISFTKSLGF